MVKTSKGNAADILDSCEMIADHLAAALEEDGPAGDGSHESFALSVEHAVAALRRLQADRGSTRIVEVIKRIRAYRKYRNWPVLQLAKEAKIPESTLRRINSEFWNPTLETIVRLEAIIPDAF